MRLRAYNKMTSEVWGFIELERLGEMATEIARLSGQTDGTACGIVVGEVDSNLLAELGNCGIAKLYLLEPPVQDALTPEGYTYLVTCLIEKSPPYVCLFPASPLGSEVASRVAVRLNTGLIPWCVDFRFADGKLMAVKKTSDRKKYKLMDWCCPPPYLATVDPEVMEVIRAERTCLPIIQQETFPLFRPSTKLVGRSRLSWSEIPIAEGVGVLGVGAGVKDREGMNLIERLAERLDMPIGGTKRADELSLISRERRVGASGAYIEPDVYIAIGISGASHHLAGIRKAKHVVAINQDKTSPIFDIAELGVIDDFRPVVLALLDQLGYGPDSTSTPGRI